MATSEQHSFVDNTPATHIPSEEEIERSQSKKNSWTRETLASWGVPWPPPKGWKKRLID